MAYVQLTIPAGKVSADLTNFPVYVDLSTLPTDFWTGVSSDGGNIRAKTSADVALATDIVWINTATHQGCLFFNADSLLTASSNVFKLDLVFGATKLTNTDTYGRNAVWADYEVVSLLGIDPQDRSGKNPDLLISQDPNGFAKGTAQAFTDNPQEGVTWDGTYWYLFNTTAIYKYDSSFTLVSSATTLLADSGIANVNRIADGCYYNGYLYTVFEKYTNSPYNNQHLVKIDPATLTIVATYNISAQSHECSSICYCPIDGYFYIVSKVSDTSIYKYSTTGSYIGSVLNPYSGSHAAISGIEWFNGAFWLSSATFDEVFRFNYDGTIVESGTFGDDISGGTLRGLCAKDNSLYLLETYTSANSQIRPWTPNQLPKSAGGGHSFPGVGGSNLYFTNVADFSTLTLATTFALTNKTTATKGGLSYQTAGGTNRVLLTPDFATTSSIAIRDGINSTLASTFDPAQDTYYRVHVSYNGTSTRSLYVDGALNNSNATVTTLGTGRNALAIGGSNGGTSEPMAGYMGFVYLRPSVLSAAWIAAEYSNLNAPSSFYLTEFHADSRSFAQSAALSNTQSAQFVAHVIASQSMALASTQTSAARFNGTRTESASLTDFQSSSVIHHASYTSSASALDSFNSSTQMGASHECRFTVTTYQDRLYAASAVFNSSALISTASQAAQTASASYAESASLIQSQSGQSSQSVNYTQSANVSSNAERANQLAAYYADTAAISTSTSGIGIQTADYVNEFFIATSARARFANPFPDKVGRCKLSNQNAANQLDVESDAKRLTIAKLYQ